MKRKIVGSWLAFFAWAFYGQLVSIVTKEGLIPSSISAVLFELSELVPSISHIRNSYIIDTDFAKIQSLIMLASIPMAFFLLLLVNVEKSVHCVREKEQEIAAILLFAVVGVLPLFGGFGFAGPAKVFQSSVTGFAFLSSLVTYISAYSFRLIYCVAFKK